jgi:uncharacterized protein YerC
MARVRSSAGRNRYRWDYQELRYLVYVLNQTKDFREILNLFLDLHTRKEIAEIIRRLMIASMIAQGLTYVDIQKATGASPNTVAALINRLLREKSVVSTMLERAGTFEDFDEKTGKRGSQLGKKLDRYLRSYTSGILGNGPEKMK